MKHEALRRWIDARSTADEALELLTAFDALVAKSEEASAQCAVLRAENVALRGMRRLAPNESLKRSEREAAWMFEAALLTRENEELRAQLEALRS